MPGILGREIENFEGWEDEGNRLFEVDNNDLLNNAIVDFILGMEDSEP